mmetsp:Transcript_25314/g.84850  ORF Transcript_25314/g.84850 Transcript_25314/m.84850 type:complete len:285 (-) Transcript_25314:74-928(-)
MCANKHSAAPGSQVPRLLLDVRLAPGHEAREHGVLRLGGVERGRVREHVAHALQERRVEEGLDKLRVLEEALDHVLREAEALGARGVAVREGPARGLGRGLRRGRWRHGGLGGARGAHGARDASSLWCARVRGCLRGGAGLGHAHLRREGHGRLAHGIHRGQVRAVLDQQGGHRRVVAVAGDVQRGVAVAVHRVDVGLPLQEGLGDLQVATGRGVVQGRPLVLVPGVRVAPALEAVEHDGQVAVEAGNVDGEVPVLVDHVHGDVRSGLHDAHEAGNVALLRAGE